MVHRGVLIALAAGLTALVAFGAIVLHSLLTPVELPPIATDLPARALERGARGPNSAGLRRAVLRYVAMRPAPEVATTPARVCVDAREAYEAGVPDGNWVPTPEDFRALEDAGLNVVVGGEACDDAPYPTVWATLARPARWWNEPAEFEIECVLFYRAESHPHVSIEVVNVVAVRETSRWRVVREEKRPDAHLY